MTTLRQTRETWGHANLGEHIFTRSSTLKCLGGTITNNMEENIKARMVEEIGIKNV